MMYNQTLLLYLGTSSAARTCADPNGSCWGVDTLDSTSTASLGVPSLTVPPSLISPHPRPRCALCAVLHLLPAAAVYLSRT